MKNWLLVAAIDAENAGIPKLSEGEVLANALNIVYFLAGAIAVIVIIIGGIMYVTSAGDSGAVSKAKNMVLYSVIGLVVVIAAFAVTNFVLDLF